MEENYVRHELEVQPETMVILLDGNLLLYTKKKQEQLKLFQMFLQQYFNTFS